MKYVPANPAEGANGTESRALGNARGGVAAVGVANGRRESSGTSEPEDPGEDDKDSVRSNRREETTNAGQEETDLNRLVCCSQNTGIRT